MEFITMQEPGGKRAMINNRPPVISCICVTRKKPALLERAVRCFLIQSYQQKELVIVYEDDDQVTIDHIGNMELAARKSTQTWVMIIIDLAPD